MYPPGYLLEPEPSETVYRGLKIIVRDEAMIKTDAGCLYHPTNSRIPYQDKSGIGPEFIFRYNNLESHPFSRLAILGDSNRSKT